MAAKSAKWRKAIMGRIVERDGYYCNVCGADGFSTFLTVDHIQKLRHRGSHRIENLQLLCRLCHYEKDGHPSMLKDWKLEPIPKPPTRPGWDYEQVERRWRLIEVQEDSR